jgi:hypothetical protein
MADKRIWKEEAVINQGTDMTEENRRASKTIDDTSRFVTKTTESLKYKL